MSFSAFGVVPMKTPPGFSPRATFSSICRALASVSKA